MDREELIKTVTRINEIRSEMTRLAGLKEELKRLEAAIDQAMGNAPPVNPSGSGRGGLSVEEAIAQFLEAHPERDWNAEQVAQELQTKLQTTRAVFSKLRKAERVVDTRRGYVQAAGAKKTGLPEEQGELLGPVKVA